jgi:hypothetical protein
MEDISETLGELFEHLIDTIPEGVEEDVDRESYVFVLNINCYNQRKTVNNTLSHLPKYKRISNNDTLLIDQKECNLCNKCYKKGTYKRELPCKHVFHKGCIDRCLIQSENMECPTCKISYKETEEETEPMVMINVD